MKKFFITALSISFFSILLIWSSPIPVQGTWDPRGPRSPIQIPEPPAAFIEDGVLLVRFTDALSGLTVTVAEVSGPVVYQDIVSGDSGDTLIIPLTSGSYLLTLEHRDYGFLRGEFSVE